MTKNEQIEEIVEEKTIDEMTEDEKKSKVVEMNNLLQQKDYTARKVAFECARILKQMFPDAEMPVYDKYREMEEKAEIFRQTIDEIMQ